jgi:hypothetical protein
VSCTPKLAIDFNTTHRLFSALTLSFSLVLGCSLFAQELSDDRTVRVFIFAGQSNMVGSDSRVQDIKGFNLPPQEKKLVIDTGGIIELGNLIAKQYLSAEKKSFNQEK